MGVMGGKRERETVANGERGERGCIQSTETDS